MAGGVLAGTVGPEDDWHMMFVDGAGRGWRLSLLCACPLMRYVFAPLAHGRRGLGSSYGHEEDR